MKQHWLHRPILDNEIGQGMPISEALWHANSSMLSH